MITISAPDRLHRIAILGLGRSGLAAAHLALSSGLEVCAFDDQISCPDTLPKACWQEPQSWDMADLDALILSPGIPHSYPAPHPIAAAAIAANVPILSDIELTITLQEASRWIVITGTNGKSTTTALIGHILEQAGLSVAVGGNLGPALAGLPAPGAEGIRVVECSSYQLERTPSLVADAAVILNITPDHLDRHGGMDGYIAAKSKALDAVGPGGLKLLGSGSACDTLHQTYTDARRLAPAETPEAVCDNPALQGVHNLENIAAAIEICRHFGVAETDIITGINSFAGLPHRMQPCGHDGKIAFINDSKATNGEASAKALASFENIHWIAGGIAKADGLDACLDYAPHIKAAYFYGQAAAQFSAEAAGQIRSHRFDSLSSALSAAYLNAQKDKEADQKAAVILLSPAAASFDQFTSFEARGTHFMEMVASLLHPTRREAGHAG